MSVVILVKVHQGSFSISRSESREREVGVRSFCNTWVDNTFSMPLLLTVDVFLCLAYYLDCVGVTGQFMAISH